MEIYSRKLLFNNVNGICLVTYQTKKNKNPVMLLSSSHADNLVATNETKNPVLILDYDKEKEEWACLMKIWKNFHAEEKQLDIHFFLQYY